MLFSVSHHQACFPDMEFEDSSSESDDNNARVKDNNNVSTIQQQQQQQLLLRQQQLQQQLQQQQQQQAQAIPSGGQWQATPTTGFIQHQPLTTTAFVNGILINNGNAISVINAQDLVLFQQQPIQQQQQQQQLIAVKTDHDGEAGAGAIAGAGAVTYHEREVLPEEEKNRHQSEVKDLNIIRVGKLTEEVRLRM